MDRVSSRRIKADLKADKVAPDTWTTITRKVDRDAPKKETYGQLRFSWNLKGGSFVRMNLSTNGNGNSVSDNAVPGLNALTGVRDYFTEAECSW